MLCDTCLELLDTGRAYKVEDEDEDGDDEWTTFSKPVAEILSKKQTCHICSRLRTEVLEWTEIAGSEESVSVLFCCEFSASGPLFVVEFKLSTEVEPRPRMIGFVGQSLQAKHLSQSYDALEPRHSTSSEATFDFARKLLYDCTQSHSGCEALEHTQTKPFCPTRLIDLFDTASDEFKVVTLATLDASRIEDPLRYATLSHPWGGATFETLNTASIHALMDRPSRISALPATFRNAVTVTKALNIRYLWIDALCIVQDSPNDFEKEVALMGLVYANSLVNIAACAARNPSEGFFRTCKWEVKSCIQAVGQSVESKEDLYLIMDDHFLEKGFEGTPLLGRGWVLQEILLSPRTLYFGNEQVFWGCREHLACETHPYGIPAGLLELSRDYKNIDGIVPNFLGDSADRRTTPDDFWGRIVSNYSTCTLTKESDKLFAIEGIASYVQKTRSDQYIAGMWRSSLPFSLLWLVHSTRRPARSPTLGLPTWSWASIGGGIIPAVIPTTADPLNDRYTSLCDVLEVSAAPEQSGHSKLASLAQIQLRCHMISVGYAGTFDGCEEVDDGLSGAMLPDAIRLYEMDALVRATLDTEPRDEESLFCAFIAATPGGHVKGLILESTDLPFVFTRVGYFGFAPVSNGILLGLEALSDETIMPRETITLV